ncbi:phosphate ABC transporter permease subunit PstC [Gulosibacter chungangensis]|uniref:Phosphate transport system permease protein n=1 Tax=Gulosibacter chungangensis TaxID=979746 RepID=A0A7J5BAG5_9MICO|nr:phosphate ABC transporter permease subunit PstC [Gulosibacter chungangensis]KAB1643082.1 phosphate ABC transporter permease subunit PstC [Gulosibacter chungangensis]
MTSTDTAAKTTEAAQSRTAVRRIGDIVFKTISTTSGSLILAILAAVFLFLLVQGLPAIFTPVDPENHSDSFRAATGSFWGYIGPLVFGTIWSSLLAMILAIPVGISVALFISHFSNRKFQGAFGFVIDMLAAVPSVVFGLWGILVFAPTAGPLYTWLGTHMQWFPLFSGTPLASGRNMATAVVVLAIMILPIITSLTREIFLQTPRLHEEASLALGATRWEMVQQAVFPYARSGIFASAILALGRALGETMAVAMVLSASGLVTFELLTSQNSQTIAGQIANQYPEASGMNSNTLIAGGLVLFAITLAVNSLGRWIIAKSKK